MTDPNRKTSAPRGALVALACAALLVSFAGCGGLGLPGTSDPEPERYPPETAVTGEIVRIDTTDREIEIDDAGRRHVVIYETTTPVYFEGRTYQPENLERGDVIRARVRDDRYGTLTTDRIDVVESVQSRGDSRDPYEDDPYEDDPYDDRVAELSGEIDRVDTDRREIVIRTRSGDRLIAYDDRTRVVYQGREYEPENLERGDLVEIDTTTTSTSRYTLAERIEVTRSVQDRTGYDDDSPAGEQVSGTVDWVDRSRGEFGLRTDRDTLTVEVPFDAEAATRDRFNRLDRGDYVRIEVEELERTRLELVRFL